MTDMSGFQCKQTQLNVVPRSVEASGKFYMFYIDAESEITWNNALYKMNM